MKYAGVLICVTDGAFLFAGEGDGRPTLAIPALAFKCFGSVPDARNNPPLSVNTRTWFQPSELWIFPLKKKKKGKKEIYFILLIFVQAAPALMAQPRSCWEVHRAVGSVVLLELSRLLRAEYNWAFGVCPPQLVPFAVRT